MKAPSQNAVVEAECHFYRMMPTGQVRQFYTVEIKQARVMSLKQMNPDRLVPATANLPPMEEASFAFGLDQVDARPGRAPTRARPSGDAHGPGPRRAGWV